MNEHGFIRAVHRQLRDDVFRWKIHDKFAGGVPDTMYVGPAGAVFVEYKYLKSLPKRPDTPVKINLSALQIAWMREVTLQSKSEITCFAVIGCANNAFIVSIDDLCSTISSKEAQEKCMSFAEVARFIEGTCGYGNAGTCSKSAASVGKEETIV